MLYPLVKKVQSHLPYYETAQLYMIYSVHTDRMKNILMRKDKLLKEAACLGQLDMINFLIEKGANDWNFGMYGAAKGGRLDLVESFIQKGADYWEMGLCGAAEGGHLDLVDLFIEKGADEYYISMYYAIIKKIVM